jgi:LDH2 family malate/lactate/ureidoglycolate dehydrogenase
MNVSIHELRQTCISILKVRGLNDHDAAVVADHFVDAELRNHKTHGVTKFLTMNQAIRQRGTQPTITSESGVVVHIDGNRELGALGATFCVDTLLDRVAKNGLSVVIMRNIGRYGCLYPFGKRIADAGKIGIVMNSGGPATVAPPGSYSPLLGSNPFCLAFPRRDTDSLVIDMATSDTAWSHSFIGFVEGYPLPPETFFDREGNYTTRPQSARALKPFGGAKGYALCLALEVICGALIGGKMGTALKNDYDCGFLFMAIDPGYFRGDSDAYYQEIEAFFTELKAAPLREGEVNAVRLPGEGSEAARQRAIETGYIELDDYTWDLLNRMTLDPQTGLNLGVGKGFR